MVALRKCSRHLLLWLARSPAGRLVVGQIFTHMSFLLPIERLWETETVLAFHHPQPTYPLHILLVPHLHFHLVSGSPLADERQSQA